MGMRRNWEPHLLLHYSWAGWLAGRDPVTVKREYPAEG